MMANKASRPGRTVVVFLLAVLAMLGGLALEGTWEPKLGLDLQGGTRITLEASTETGEEITPEKMAEATAIIDSRVNAYGVAESEVSTQGDRNIVVEIPGPSQKSIVDSVRQTAQLRFRLVAASGAGVAAPSASPTPEPSGEATPAPGDSASPSEGQTPKDEAGPAEESASPKGRAVSRGLVRLDETPTEAPGATPTGQTPTGEEPPASEEPATPATVPTDESSIEEILAWTRAPDAKWQAKFDAFTCDQTEPDNPGKPLLACDDSGAKYLLSPSIIEGTELDDAGFGIPQQDVQYVVTLDFDGAATKTFADVTRAIVGTGEQFAIVLDGAVLSAPVVNSPITNGSAEISGDFDADSAQSLANSLKYGALPLRFELLDITDEGPQLAADQLSAGVWAGILGLILVSLICLVYYRGLGLVVVSSLGVAGVLTYGMILFLSQTAGFTLTLPGIAGLIVGVGITADSFIVFFERIRDEMRDGKSVRVAIEAGWHRAKWTCVIADSVSLLASVVLYIFAIGVVKGFAFALGITTLIDLVVFFWFTKPLVSWLGQYRFFGQGHPLSGLSAAQAGIERIGAPRPSAEGMTR